LDTVKRERIWKLRHGTERFVATAVTWSPDGQRLVSGDVNGLAEVWEVSTGQKVVSAPLHTARITALAWSPDGRRIASGSMDKTVRIWDPTRGEELLRLDVPGADVTQCQWSPDGRRLAASGADGTILIWDASPGFQFLNSQQYVREQVRAQVLAQWNEILPSETDRMVDALPLLVRMLENLKSTLGPDHEETVFIMRRLGRLGLALSGKGRPDEAIEAYREAIGFAPDSAESYFRLGLALSDKGRPDEAIAAYREAIGFGFAPDFAKTYNELAWHLVISSDPKFRDPARAVELARKAVELAPQQASIRNTLGVAHYRAGDWKAAIVALEKAEALRPDAYFAFNGFFLAMAHGKLGHNDEARAWYDKAVAWMAKNKPKDDELIGFRAEAAALLGLTELPADVFARPNAAR
jgi:tetratricopeptide (TPR) repeat protein